MGNTGKIYFEDISGVGGLSLAGLWEIIMFRHAIRGALLTGILAAKAISPG